MMLLVYAIAAREQRRLSQCSCTARARPAAACADCPATHVHAKFAEARA